MNWSLSNLDLKVIWILYAQPYITVDQYYALYKLINALLILKIKQWETHYYTE